MLENMDQVKVFEGELPIEAKEIRTVVFVDEQGFREEFDTLDFEATHFLYFVDEKAIGVARIYFSKKHNMISVGRFAILKEYRHLGYGKKLMDSIEEFIKNKYGNTTIGLSSQKRAVNFYQKCGFKEVGEYYLDEDYPHIWMEKNI